MNDKAKEIWKESCGHLAGILSRDVYERWIGLIDAQDMQDDMLILSVPNGFYQHWLEENYLPLIEDAVATVTARKLDIRFNIGQSDRASKRTSSPDNDNKPTTKTGTKRQSPTPTAPSVRKPAIVNGSNVKLNPNYTFESFVVGPSNHFAHAASLAVAQSPAKAYNPLFIYGGVGLGKTHLMQAIGHFILDHRNRAKVCYISSEEFVNQYIDALKKGRLVEFRKQYRGSDVLLIDDIQFLAGKDRMQEEFFHTFNALFDAHKQIVLTCDRPASEIPGLEQRLVSRFEWGLVTDLDVPDVETSIAILRKKQELLNIKLADDLITYMAERIRSNIRRLEGALIRAASFSSLTGQPLTKDRLDQLLGATFEQEKKEDLTLERIQNTVAEHYGLRISDLTRKCRSKSIAFPRQVAMYMCRIHTDQSTPVIGEAFGRDHATVLYACRKITEKLSNESALRDTISSLNAKLKS
jgi:chromosomal replication initiator protein